ncbi:hypothetical protein EV359DRAFT_85122 [Lentinula novae-zelandiae]|nr:hypothetical protein EV359DRAFT_85122 [Lentinula novae-zelandiae]
MDGLPIEIFQEIVLIAAKNQPTAISLVLVSKMVNAWITPGLYKSVRLLSQHQVLLLQRTLAGESGLALASHINHVYMGDFTAGLGKLMSALCTNITVVVVPQRTFHELLYFNPKCGVPWLTITGLLRVVHGYNLPVMKTVTHLRCTRDTPNQQFSPQVHKLSLTHFSCCYWPIDHITMHKFLPYNLAKLLDTQIQAVVVCVDLRGQYKYTAEDKIQETLENLSQLERQDKRVLVVRSMDLVEGMDDEEFWSYVEAAIAEKE